MTQRLVKRRNWARDTFVGVVSILLLTSLSSVIFGKAISPKPSWTLLFNYKVESLQTRDAKVGVNNIFRIHAYFDIGEGFTEKDSSYLDVPASSEWISVRLTVPSVVIRGLRLDPSTSPAIANIRNLRIVDQIGTVRLEISPAMIRAGNQIQSLVEKNEQVEIETIPYANDPILIVSLEEEIDLRRPLVNMKWFVANLFPVQGLFFWTVVVAFFLSPSVIQTKVVRFTCNGIVVAMCLLYSFFYINNNPTVLRQAYQWLEQGRVENRFGNSEIGQLGLAILAPLQVVADTEFLIRRNGISKSELPILRLFMTDGALGILAKRRDSTLDENSPILLSTDDGWVEASALWSDGKIEKKANTTLRLKGDWAEGGDGGTGHLANIRKLSFRIKVRNNDHIFGMSKFSIHNPTERGYQAEAIAANIMRLFGVLAPRYFFVDVRINGQTIGIMALEEHFSKELLELQDRREGPIVAIEDEFYWQQTFLNHNRIGDKTGDWIKTDSTNMVFRDHPLKVYKMGRFSPGTVHSQQVIRAVSLLRDQIDGRISGSLAYDLDLMSRWWILTNLLGAHHAHSTNNQRFYFNPISNRLEPISYDHGSNSLRQFELTSDFAIASIVTDPIFRKIIRSDIRDIENVLISKKFKVWFNDQKEKYLRILSLDDDIADKLEHLDPINMEHLIQNLAEFEHELDTVFDAIPVRDYRALYPLSRPELSKLGVNELLGTVKLEDRLRDAIHGQEFMKQSPPLNAHVRPFWFWSKEGSTIEIKNLTLFPITVHSVYLAKKPARNLLATETQIPTYKLGSTEHVTLLPVVVSETDLDDEMKIRYSYRGTEHTKPVFLQFRQHDFGYANPEATNVWLHKNDVRVNEASRTITFPRGYYILEKRLAFDRGWQVRFLPGTEIEFRRGATMRINGPVYSLGRKDSPVTLVVHSDPGRGLLGSWGGLIVLDSQRESILRHTRVVGGVGSALSERQDSHGITGCVTFYKSDVLIEDSVFDGLQCEDALNIISSEFNIDHVEFVEAGADAFDSDFSTGTVTNSIFRNVVNDGLDLSGSNVNVESTRFLDIGDKAISVGENSTLVASDLVIDGSEAGAVSKDKSVANIRNSSFRDVNNALMAYEKKGEWGPAEIHCDNCLFDNVASIAVVQHGSHTTIDGNEVAPTPFTRKQLKTAGYLQ